MTPELEVLSAGPAVTVQDEGRPGYGRFGLSAGAAMDQYAMLEGALLLGNDANLAAIEMAGYGGEFRFNHSPVAIALCGAPMVAKLDGKQIPWRQSFVVNPGQKLEIGATLSGKVSGTYGYLHIGGGIDIEPQIGARGTHLRAGVGGVDGNPLSPGSCLSIGKFSLASFTDKKLHNPEYLSQRRIRLMWGAHCNRFKQQTRDRLIDEIFRISPRRDRMAMRLDLSDEQAPFEALLTGLSDPIQDGDIQMTGDGIPAILVREHQPTGGYPRIATVIRADLSSVAQLPTGTEFQFELVTHEQATQALGSWLNEIKTLGDRAVPVIRSADQIDNLLAYNLIGGVVSAAEDEQ